MDHVESYIRKIKSALQGSGKIRISTFVEEHLRVQPLLHPLANKKKPDISALVYSILRLPPEIFLTEHIIMGQSDRVFTYHGFNDITEIS